MSMPSFPKPETILTREQAINAVIASIALEETAIAHLISAESEKVRYVIKCAKDNNCDAANMQLILDVNKSVADLIGKATNMQIALKEKLAIAVKHLSPCPPIPCYCTSKFRVVTIQWSEGGALRLEETESCKNGVKHMRKQCESQIVLPGCKEYKIELELCVTNYAKCPTTVEVIMEFRSGEKIVHQEKFSKHVKHHEKMVHPFRYKTFCESNEQSVTFRLNTPEEINIDRGKILVAS